MFEYNEILIPLLSFNSQCFKNYFIILYHIIPEFACSFELSPITIYQKINYPNFSITIIKKILLISLIIIFVIIKFKFLLIGAME